jgi:hypothetical protein
VKRVVEYGGKVYYSNYLSPGQTDGIILRDSQLDHFEYNGKTVFTLEELASLAKILGKERFKMNCKYIFLGVCRKIIPGDTAEERQVSIETSESGLPENPMQASKWYAMCGVTNERSRYQNKRLRTAHLDSEPLPEDIQSHVRKIRGEINRYNEMYASDDPLRFIQVADFTGDPTPTVSEVQSFQECERVMYAEDLPKGYEEELFRLGAEISEDFDRQMREHPESYQDLRDAEIE